MKSTCYVLMREVDGSDGVHASVMGVYLDVSDLNERVKKIASANAIFEMRQLNPSTWVIGPDEDEGFFGHRPVTLRAVESYLIH